MHPPTIPTSRKVSRSLRQCAARLLLLFPKRSEQSSPLGRCGQLGVPRLGLIPVVAACLAMFTGCGQPLSPAVQGGGGAGGKKERVILCAAASLIDAVETVADRFSQSQPITVQTNFASSGSLAQQLAMGVPGEVFISAHQQWSDYLAKRGMVAEAVPLLENRLVVVVPTASPLQLRRPEDLLDPRLHHLAIGDPESVPAGIYAREALERLGLWEPLQNKVVAGADVRQALAYVESGAAEAGVVYATDVRVADDLSVAFTFDRQLTEPIRYVAVLLESAADHRAARQLFHYLQSAEAGRVFRQFGFVTLQESGRPSSGDAQ